MMVLTWNSLYHPITSIISAQKDYHCINNHESTQNIINATNLTQYCTHDSTQITYKKLHKTINEALTLYYQYIYNVKITFVVYYHTSQEYHFSTCPCIHINWQPSCVRAKWNGKYMLPVFKCNLPTASRKIVFGAKIKYFWKAVFWKKDIPTW